MCGNNSNTGLCNQWCQQRICWVNCISSFSPQIFIFCCLYLSLLLTCAHLRAPQLVPLCALSLSLYLSRLCLKSTLERDLSAPVQYGTWTILPHRWRTICKALIQETVQACFSLRCAISAAQNAWCLEDLAAKHWDWRFSTSLAAIHTNHLEPHSGTSSICNEPPHYSTLFLDVVCKPRTHLWQCQRLTWRCWIHLQERQFHLSFQHLLHLWRY